MNVVTAAAEIDLEPIRELLPATPYVPGEIPREVAVRNLNEFTITEEDHGGSLLGNRWLCRGGALLLVAPTGIGKSSFTMQAAIQFALGRPHFGIAPVGKLRVLIIQAENDDGDITEMRDGIFRGLALTDQEQTEACRRIQVVCESTLTGSDFVALVSELVAKYKPDLIIVDPLFAYLGDSVCEQRAVTAFLRNGLNPILKERGCGLILVHHTNKPKSGREKPDWQPGDFAYLGSGVAELANWARATIGIRSIGSHNVFGVILDKRGKRAGLIDDDGKPIYRFHIKHSAIDIFWEPATTADYVRPGKPRPGVEDLLRLIPAESDISQAQLFNGVAALPIGINRARQLLKELVEKGLVFEWSTPRSGTNPAKSYSRQPQPNLNP